VRSLALALPGVAEGTSYGTAAYRVRGKMFARIHQKEPAVVVKLDAEQRETLMEMDPETFYITDHYEGSSWLLVHLKRVSRETLAEVLETAWRACASKRQLAERAGSC
jgi:hypothetical protein